MILLTVGLQLPFPRFVGIMDEIAGKIDEKVIGQIGTQPDPPSHMETVGALGPEAFENLMQSARVIVSHVGAGTVLTARRLGKPIIVFPRKASLGEHRNEHQMDTAVHLAAIPGVYVAYDATQLQELIQRKDLSAAETAESPQKRELLQFLREEIGN